MATLMRSLLGAEVSSWKHRVKNFFGEMLANG